MAIPKKDLSAKKYDNQDNVQKSQTEENDFQSVDFWEYCDNCGQHLIVRKCELICPKCGFFHSCSEP